MKYRLIIAALCALSALFIALSSCGSNNDIHAGAGNAPPLAGLPALPELSASGPATPRSTSDLVLDPTITAFSPTGITTGVPAKVLEFDAGAGLLTYALLSFDAQDALPLSLNIQLDNLSGPTDSKIYLGLSNYTLGYWELVPLPADNSFEYVSGDDYTAPVSGAVYVAFIAWDGISGDLTSLTLTTDGNPATFSINGTVTDDGSGAPGVILALLLDGNQVGTSLTSIVGAYGFIGLASGNYEVVPSQLSGSWVFDPVSRVYPALSSNQTNQNFERNPAGTTFSISGTILEGLNPLPGVQVDLTGFGIGSTTSGIDGTYSFSGLGPGSYTVTPTLQDYSFNPTNHAVMIVNSDMPGNDFAATFVPPPTYSISGVVTDGTNPMEGVTIDLTGDAAGSTLTASDGTFSFTGLAPGSYTMTPSFTGWSFAPTFMNRIIVNTDFSDVFFTGSMSSTTYTISGQTQDGSIGVPGVNLQLAKDGADAGILISDANGDYAFTGLIPGNYTVTPSEFGYTFTPSSYTFMSLSADSSGNNFERELGGPPPLPGIYGTITSSGSPEAGVVVHLIKLGGTGAIVSHSSDTTDAQGRYSFSGQTSTTYRIIPQKENFGFTPAMHIIDYSSSAEVTRNFNAIFYASVPATVTYDEHMKPLLFGAVCMNCHNSAHTGDMRNFAPVDVNWDTYNGTDEATKLFGNVRIHNGSMPPAALGFTTTQFEKDLFQAWEDGGFLEN